MANQNERATELGLAILAATFETTIAKTKTFQIAMADMPTEAILALLAHGTQRKFNDAVGGADKDAKTKVDLAAAMIEDYKAGKVRRAATAAVPQVHVVMRRLVKAMVKVQASTEKWKTFAGLDAAAQNAKLDALIESMPEADKIKLAEQAETEIEIAQQKAEEAKALAGAFTFDL